MVQYKQAHVTFNDMQCLSCAAQHGVTTSISVIIDKCRNNRYSSVCVTVCKKTHRDGALGSPTPVGDPSAPTCMHASGHGVII